MMLPPKVRRSTIAAHKRGSVKVLVQEPKLSLEAIATEFFSSLFRENLEQQFSAAAVQLHVTELVDAQQVYAAVAGDGLGQDLVVGGLDQLVDQLRGQGVLDPVARHGGLGAQGDEQVRLAGTGVSHQAQRQALLYPLAGGQGVDGGGVQTGVGGEVEGPQRFLPGEPGALDPAFGAAAGPVVALGHQQLGQERAVGHLLMGRGVGDAGNSARIVGSRSIRHAWSVAASAACSVSPRWRWTLMGCS